MWIPDNQKWVWVEKTEQIRNGFKIFFFLHNQKFAWHLSGVSV